MADAGDIIKVSLGAGLAVAFGGKELMVKFLGPTAEYLGT